MDDYNRNFERLAIIDLPDENDLICQCARGVNTDFANDRNHIAPLSDTALQ